MTEWDENFFEAEEDIKPLEEKIEAKAKRKVQRGTKKPIH